MWNIFFAYLAGAGTAIVAIAALSKGSTDDCECLDNRPDDELEKEARKAE